MIRRIIKIDKEKCNGCGACVTACHEGAIKMEGGKAGLAREDYCDGLGDCLPACPTGAISFEEREALSYDEKAVQSAKAASPCGCPSSAARSLHRAHESPCQRTAECPGRLLQWPCQIKLVPVGAPYFDGADLLIAADCTAYAYGNFHNDFMKGRITLIGCPKLDMIDYTDKLTQIIALNNIRSISVVRMEVPCCSGIENAVRRAIEESGKFIPKQVITISTDGKILN